MAPNKTKSTRKINKPILIKVGKHYINPADIRCISQVRKDLFIVKFFSDPNPLYPCWVAHEDINILLEQFKVIVSDDGE